MVTFIVVTIFSLVIINIFINLQSSAAIESIEYSSSAFGNSLKAQSHGLHLLNKGDLAMGSYEKSNFQNVVENCHILENLDSVQESLLGFGGSTAPIFIETSSNDCEAVQSIQNPIILGVETKEGGESDIEKVIIK